MALIKSDSGAKVGWETYDNEDEAKARAEQVGPQRDDMLRRGYDFGYCWPGTVQANKDGTWTVTIP